MATGKLVKALTEDLLDYSRDIDYEVDSETPFDERGGDVRLRLHEGTFSLKTGPSDYDQDHRGYWGSAWVPSDADRDGCEEVARDLIEQVAEDRAEARIAAKA